MSWHFSQALEAEYLAANCSGGEPSALSRLTNTAAECLCKDKMMECSIHFPFGMTCEHSTGGHGAELLTWFQAASRARTSASQEREPESTESGQDSGAKWRELLARYDRDSHSWKTPQCSLFEDSTESLRTLPRWGSVRNGELFQRRMPDLPTTESAYGLLPTPTATIWKRGIEWTRAERMERIRSNLEDFLAYLFLRCGGQRISGTQIHPSFVEAMMGWPIEWGVLRRQETARFQQWLDSHGEY